MWEAMCVHTIVVVDTLQYSLDLNTSLSLFFTYDCFIVCIPLYSFIELIVCNLTQFGKFGLNLSQFNLVIDNRTVSFIFESLSFNLI